MPFDMSEAIIAKHELTRSLVECCLRRAYELLEQGWIQGPFAVRRALTGCVAVDPADGQACAFCSAGALQRAAWEIDPNHMHLVEFGHWPRRQGPLYLEARKFLDGVCPAGNIVWFNERYGRTKEEVLAVFRVAIARSNP
jgi:hypothetical protein